jgi:cell division protein ZapA
LSSVNQACEIEVYGHRYTIRGEAGESYVRELAKQVDERMRTLAAKMKNVTALQLAVLTAINLADELNQATKQHDQHAEDMNRRAACLIATIEQSLGKTRSS